jgi:hypothetical protein
MKMQPDVVKYNIRLFSLYSRLNSFTIERFTTCNSPKDKHLRIVCIQTKPPTPTYLISFLQHEPFSLYVPPIQQRGSPHVT